MPSLDGKSQLMEMKAEETWWLKAAAGLLEKWMVEILGSGENEGTGSWGRLEGSLERQDCKVVAMTLQILSLKRFAIAVSIFY